MHHSHRSALMVLCDFLCLIRRAVLIFHCVLVRNGRTDIVEETGGIVSIKDDVRDVANAIQMNRKTVRKIKENLSWAFIYNIILIPIAAGLLIPFFGLGAILNPIYAAVAMALSSITVTLNSMFLNRWRPGS